MKSAIELLLVGSSPARIENISENLSNLPGFRLHVAASLDEARNCLTASPPDLIIALAGGPGAPALHLLESDDDFPRFPLLLIIDRDDTPTTVEAINAGAMDVLVESPDALKLLPQTVDAARAEWKQRRNRYLANTNAARFGHILAFSLTEIYTFDATTLMFIRVNHGALQNIGYSKQELLQMTPLDLKPQLTREQFEQLLAPLRSGKKETVRFETLHRRKDGSTYPIVVQLQYVQAEPEVFVAVILDISEWKQAEEKLQASETRFHSVFDTAPAGLAILTPHGEILEVNPFFCDFCGYSTDELIGSNIREVTHPDDRERTVDYYKTLREGQHPIINVEKRYLRKDGQVRWGHASITCVPGQTESEIYCIGLVQDITRHKEAETKMQQAYGELDAFVRTVAHDLRNPLTPIIGIAEFLQGHASEVLDKTALDFLADIENTGHRMLALLEDLLALSQVGHIKQPVSPTDTRQAVDEALMNLSGQISAARIKVDIGDLTPICIPPTLLGQQFENLIGNAIRYAGKVDQPIEIGEQRLEHQVVFYVRDYGPGIPEEEREHIFEVFYRGEAGRPVSGSGIGLATVRKIARLYNGEAWVEPTPGGGSTFMVSFPLAALSCTTDDKSES